MAETDTIEYRSTTELRKLANQWDGDKAYAIPAGDPRVKLGYKSEPPRVAVRVISEENWQIAQALVVAAKGPTSLERSFAQMQEAMRNAASGIAKLDWHTATEEPWTWRDELRWRWNQSKARALVLYRNSDVRFALVIGGLAGLWAWQIAGIFA